MTLGIVIAIILIGLLLIFLEIFLIPGTTLFGVVGGIALLIGVVMVYSYYGSKWGNITLLASSLSVAISVVLGFKVIQSNKLAMKAKIDGRVNELENAEELQIGARGITVTELRPIGKAVFAHKKLEVSSTGDYIHRETEVEIIQISGNKIIVQPIKS
jgi:membrane-bound ClpP family serine protease